MLSTIFSVISSFPEITATSDQLKSWYEQALIFELICREELKILKIRQEALEAERRAEFEKLDLEIKTRIQAEEAEEKFEQNVEHWDKLLAKRHRMTKAEKIISYRIIYDRSY